jgi:hypothetical protein
MKILIISQPRCRTSLLCDVFKNYYKIHNYGEDFDIRKNIFENAYSRQKMTGKEIALDDLQNTIRDHLSNVVSQIKQKDGVVKLFPRYLFSYISEKHIGINTPIEQFRFNVICDISNVLNLKMFDKILLLNRDLVEATMSWLHGLQTQVMTIYDPTFYKYISKKNERVLIQDEFLKYANFFILEHIIFNQLSTFITHNYNTLYLENNSIPKYINDNLQGVETKYYDTKYDYKDKIINYYDLKSYIETTYKSYIDKIPYFVFQ